MTPSALLHVATGTSPAELDRDEQVALAWSLAEELAAVPRRAAIRRLSERMPRSETWLGRLSMGVALRAMLAAALRAYERGDRDAVAACFGVKGAGW